MNGWHPSSGALRPDAVLPPGTTALERALIGRAVEVRVPTHMRVVRMGRDFPYDWSREYD